MSQISDLVFWPACVRLRDFEEHVAAAAAGGFTSMAIAAETYDACLARGLTPRDMRSMAEDANVPIRHLDTLTAWAPIRIPPGAGAEMRARFDVTMEHSLEVCVALGITNILAVAGYPPGAVSHDQLVQGFADLCDTAKALGMWVDLEFMPFLGMPDLAAAWAIVEPAGRDNSGIMIDTWHFAKSESGMDLLRSIPGRYLRSIQLSDGYRAQRGESLFDDTLSWRAFPGEGDLPVLDIMRTVAAGGHLTNVGSEVFSIRANQMSALEAGRLSGETSRAMLAIADSVA